MKPNNVKCCKCNNWCSSFWCVKLKEGYACEACMEREGQKDKVGFGVKTIDGHIGTRTRPFV